jgi:hypothetical protein
MNPDNDNLVAWHNAVLRRKFAVPKSVTEATKKRILELPFLACYSSKLVSLDPLARLQSLERVNARKNRELVAIEALSELEKLREVSVVLTAVADLRPLSKCR